MEPEADSAPSIRPDSSAIGIQGAHTVHLTNANINIAGRDTHAHTHTHTHVHLHGDTSRAFKTIWDAILNFRKIQQDTLAKATPGTVTAWLFKTEYFIAWWDGAGNIQVLWGTGIPGAGKTILMSIVIHEIERRAKEARGTICVAYFYLRYSEHAEVTVRGVLEVLVKQTLERHPELRPLAYELYEQHISESTQPTEEELLGLLSEFISRKSVTCYFLDALDEAPIDIQLELVQKLTSLNARIFITSRPMKDVQACVPEARCFEIAANDHDLELHIHKRLEGIPRLRALFREDAAQKQLVIDIVKTKCGGMFLHASLQLDALHHCLTLHSVVKTLNRFPSKIEDVYEQTWMRILNQDQEHADLAKVALLWVLYAKHSLSIEVLCCAMATCPDSHRFETARLIPSSTIIDLCHGLLILDEESRLVRLVHYTAKPPMVKFLLNFFPYPSSRLASVCMSHLAACGFQDTAIASSIELREALKTDSLLAYAHNAWAVHAQQALYQGSALSPTLEFIKGCHAFPAMIGRDQFDKLSPLHILAFYNLPTFLAWRLADQDPNARTRIQGATPLVLACAMGHFSAASHLLSMSTTYINAADRDGDTALIYAVRGLCEEIVNLLLAHPDIDVNTKNVKGYTPLGLAFWSGHHGIATLLLAHSDININLANDAGRTALITESELGHASNVSLLLGRPDTDVNFADRAGDTALMLASFGYENIVSLILAHPDTDVNLANSKGNTALMLAVSSRQESIVSLLLAHPDIDVNLANNGGDTALMMAHRSAETGIAALILARRDI